MSAKPTAVSGPCLAYTLCDRPAVLLYDFGPVGMIPTCQRCADKTDKLRDRKVSE